MNLHNIEISDEIIAEAKALTRKRNARAAIESAVAQLRNFVHEPPQSPSRAWRGTHGPSHPAHSQRSQ